MGGVLSTLGKNPRATSFITVCALAYYMYVQKQQAPKALTAARSNKICIVGSGNWGSAIARIVGKNAALHDEFQTTVEMYVYEEQVDGGNLTDIINETHENVKYLPGFKIPPNVHANPDLADACSGATLLIFVMPHQFLKFPLSVIKKNLAPGAIALSLIKGIDFDDNGIVLISDIIRQGLGGIDCSVLMGANVANEVAKEEFCETTVGYTEERSGKLWQKMLNDKMFRVATVQDTVGVELCGALKNIVAIGAGFCDGLGYGGNTKAALIRIGLLEMKRFCTKYYDGVKTETFFESCGAADLITTCYGGRNRRCAEAYAKDPSQGWDKIEADLLGGQKLQGTLTAKEVHEVLKRTGDAAEFPLFEAIYKISFEGAPCADITRYDKL
jgi:glycerol-3-phosphate dehydrogenase (NAD+)